MTDLESHREINIVQVLCKPWIVTKVRLGAKTRTTTVAYLMMMHVCPLQFIATMKASCRHDLCPHKAASIPWCVEEWFGDITVDCPLFLYSLCQ